MFETKFVGKIKDPDLWRPVHCIIYVWKMVCPFITKNIYLIKSITVLSFVQIKRIAYRRRIFDVINAILKNTQGYIAINAEYESKFAALLWIKVKISQVGQNNKETNKRTKNMATLLKIL